MSVIDPRRGLRRRMSAGRSLAVMPLLMLALGGLAGCALFPDQITDCDQDSEPVTCQRDERFTLAGMNIVVDELETVTEAGDDGEDRAHVEALLTLEGEAEGELQAQLHVVNPLTEETVVVEPDERPTAGEHTLTWDFSGQGYARRIQTDTFPPDLFIVFSDSDSDSEVTVDVMTVEYH